MTRPATWRFLRLLAEATFGLDDTNPWYRIWRRNVLAQEWSRELGYRFPKEWRDTDRAFVREQMSKDGSGDRDTRRKALRWANG